MCAEGWGAESVGGRGGQIIEVINLNDRGLGSLRSAVFVGILLVVAFAPDLARGDSGNVSEPASDMRPVWLVKDT